MCYWWFLSEVRIQDTQNTLNSSIGKEVIPFINLAVLVEKAMASHSSTLAWKIPWMEKPRKLQSMGSLQVGRDWATSLSHNGEGNGNPLQCSCLENPRDGGALWAAVSGVSQDLTRLKWLSSSSSDEDICAFKGKYKAELLWKVSKILHKMALDILDG